MKWLLCLACDRYTVCTCLSIVDKSVYVRECNTFVNYTLHKFDPSLCIQTARGLNLATRYT